MTYIDLQYQSDYDYQIQDDGQIDFSDVMQPICHATEETLHGQ